MAAKPKHKHKNSSHVLKQFRQIETFIYMSSQRQTSSKNCQLFKINCLKWFLAIESFGSWQSLSVFNIVDWRCKIITIYQMFSKSYLLNVLTILGVVITLMNNGIF